MHVVSIDRSTFVFIEGHNVPRCIIQCCNQSFSIIHPPKEKGNKREKKEKKTRNVLFDHPN